MRIACEKYYEHLQGLFGAVRVTDGEEARIDFNRGIEKALRLVLSIGESGHKIIFIGNGASAAISSHMAADFWKNAGIRAVTFNDSSLLTCIGNDFGYARVFEKPIEMFGDSGDLLMAISSSGRSENILRGVKAARSRKCKVITLSGFDKGNPLSAMGDVNFYVPSGSYGPVEIVHHSICHCLLDLSCRQRNGSA